MVLDHAITGGYDVESDLQLLFRLISHLQNPPKGGTAHDYRVWAETSTDNTGASIGIVRAYVYPHRQGLGSEDIVITIGGSGMGRDPGATKKAQVQAFIDAIRPVNDSPTVFRPFFNTARGLNIVVWAQPSVLYPWDWVGQTLINASFPLETGSTTTVLKTLAVNLAPGSGGQNLALAIAAGRNPRIQLLDPSTPIPQVVSVISSSTVGADTFLTLSSALPSIPLPGVLVFPAGGSVIPTALAILNWIDSIGPSQQCGFYDKVTDAWESIVTIGKLAWAALGATDASGQLVNVFSPAVGQYTTLPGIGITIAVGGGPAQALDVQLFDSIPNPTPAFAGPEMPWTQSILVIPPQV